MHNNNSRKRYPLLIIAGLLVLCFGRRALPMVYEYSTMLYIAVVLVWTLLLVSGALLIYRYTWSAKYGCTMVWVFFMLGLHPLVTEYSHINDNMWISRVACEIDRPTLFILRFMSITATAVVFTGLMLWRGSHRILLGLDWLRAFVFCIPGWLLLCFITVVFAITAVAAGWYCYRFLPVIPDTITQLQHARIFANWRLYDHAPLMIFKNIFPLYIIVEQDGKWYSSYQPLHIFLLAIGYLLNAPWLVTPVMGALTILMCYLLALRLYGKAQAYIAALLAFASPFIFFMASSYMSHATALVLCLVFIALFAEMQKARESLRGKIMGFMAGICAGCVFLCRPLTAVALVAPFGLYTVWLLWTNRHRYLLRAVMIASGGMVCLAFQSWYNLQLTGSVWSFPYVIANAENVPGFTGRHSLSLAFSKAIAEWNMLNLVLFEWYVPCTIFALVAVLLRRDRYTWLLASTVLSMTLFNLLNRFASFTWGPRYMYEASGLLIVLSSAGLRDLPSVVEKWRRINSPPGVVRGGIVLLVLLIFATGWVHRVPESLRVYAYDYQHGKPVIYNDLTSRSDIKRPAVVFIPHNKYHQMAFNLPAYQDSPLIFAVDLGAKNCDTANLLPGRHYYTFARANLLSYNPCPASRQPSQSSGNKRDG